MYRTYILDIQRRVKRKRKKKILIPNAKISLKLLIKMHLMSCQRSVSSYNNKLMEFKLVQQEDNAIV
jgi:hypothetical protein